MRRIITFIKGYILLFSIIFFYNCQSNFERNIITKSSKIDSLCQKWDTDKSPGLSITISENNRIVYSSNFGMANLDKGEKINIKTTFNIASLTKQFVAYAILLLEEEGKISLEADIKDYLPELKYSGVKVSHLLHHTSGIPEHWGIWSLSTFKGNTIEDIYNIHKNQLGTKFTPGDKYEYCNSNYVLLSLIIKRVSNQSVIDFTRERIFKDLGMKNTYFLLDTIKNNIYQAENYQFNGEKYIASPQVVSDIVGDGGLFSSAEDLMKWSQIFYENSSINIKRKDISSVNMGTSGNYGAGLQKFVRDGVVSYEHGGGAQGVSCYFAQFPGTKVSILILANTDEVNAMSIFEKVKGIVFESLSEKKKQDSNIDDVDDSYRYTLKKIKSLEGNYYGFGSDIATSFNIKTRGKDTLVANSFGRPARKYIQSGVDEFSAVDLPDLKIKMQPNKFTLHYQKYSLGQFKRIDEDNKIENARILGNYTSPSINNGVWTVSEKESGLEVTNPRLKTFKLTRLSSNFFKIEGMNILLCFRENLGRIYVKLIHQGAGEVNLEKSIL
jgi:CubicO group peptidase (beta-lactamase class C family)